MKIRHLIGPWVFLLGYSNLAPTILHAFYTGNGAMLLEAPGARSVSLGEAFTAVKDDITAMAYNPASLATLNSSQLSLFYQRGLVNDAHGQILTGFSKKGTGYGFSASYYDGGQLELYNESSKFEMTGSKDLALSLGVAQKKGKAGYGFGIKYLSTQIVEGVKGHAIASDWGLSYNATPKFQMGASLQNIGSAIKYQQGTQELPVTGRLGLVVDVFTTPYPTLFLSQLTYNKTEKSFSTGVGLESNVGPLSFRMGIEGTEQDWRYAFGTGFSISGFSVDYALSMAPQIDAQHKMSVLIRFGNSSPGVLSLSNAGSKMDIPGSSNSNQTRLSQSKENTQITFQQESSDMEHNPGWDKLPTNKVYEVKDGDSWITIAKRFYGDIDIVHQIKAANQAYLKTDKEPKVGQKILLP